MANTYNTVTVGTAAVKVIAANNWRRGFNVYNAGGATCYVGFDSSVTTSNGTLDLINDSYADNGYQNYQGDVYMISGSSGQDIRYLEWTK